MATKGFIHRAAIYEIMADPYARIVENFKNPRNMGSLKGADIVCKDVNSSCGDELEFYIRLDGGKIKEIRFSGMACATSTATASMLTEFVKGKNLGEIEMLGEDDIMRMVGIRLNRDKLKCAMLPLSAIKLGIRAYDEKHRKAF